MSSATERKYRARFEASRAPLHSSGEARGAADAIMTARVLVEHAVTVGDLATLDAELHELELGFYRRADEFEKSGVRTEGDRRAAEMRERCAAWCDGQANLYNAYRERDERAGSPNAERMRDHFITLADAGRNIRALPLDPPETT